MSLRISTLAEETLKYFSYFSQETGFNITLEIVFREDKLHEMSNPVY